MKQFARIDNPATMNIIPDASSAFSWHSTFVPFVALPNLPLSEVNRGPPIAPLDDTTIILPYYSFAQACLSTFIFTINASCWLLVLVPEDKLTLILYKLRKYSFIFLNYLSSFDISSFHKKISPECANNSHKNVKSTGSRKLEQSEPLSSYIRSHKVHNIISGYLLTDTISSNNTLQNNY